jgi:cell wall-associated NlpC family hydrolase
MPTGQQLAFVALTQRGDRYVFGAETRPTNPNPSAWDCSELVEWSCARLGVKIPDGAYNQWKHCRRISVAQAIKTPGALLFVGDGTGTGRNAITHVAISLGDGTTIEARSARFGVGSWTAYNRGFRYGGLVPGISYTVKRPPVTPLPTQPAVDLVAIKNAVDWARTQILKAGSRGDAVRILQTQINNLTGRGLRVDGVFGPTTTKAVTDFQRWFGLPPDGVVGPLTWRVLFQ